MCLSDPGCHWLLGADAFVMEEANSLLGVEGRVSRVHRVRKEEGGVSMSSNKIVRAHSRPERTEEGCQDGELTLLN